MDLLKTRIRGIYWAVGHLPNGLLSDSSIESAKFVIVMAIIHEVCSVKNMVYIHSLKC